VVVIAAGKGKGRGEPVPWGCESGTHQNKKRLGIREEQPSREGWSTMQGDCSGLWMWMSMGRTAGW